MINNTIIDVKDLYLIGASLKDAGRLTFAAARKSHDAFIVPMVRQFYRTEAA